MAGKTKSMEQVRNILQQRNSGHSLRGIAHNTKVSRNTIKAYLSKIKEADYTLCDALSLNDEALAKIIFEPGSAKVLDARQEILKKKLAYYAKELGKRHVTRQILWEEYRQEFREGFGYTRFCHYLNSHIGHKDVTAIFDHYPGEKLMVDFAGSKLSYINKSTGEIIDCEVLVTAFPFSSYIYLEALVSQRQEHFIRGLMNAFQYLGGVPQSVLCDNLRSAVKKSNRYEPSFTELINQLSQHYQITFMATRPRKPRDKSTVETSVRVSYQRIYAKLRNLQCHSLQELNSHIKEALEQLNRRNMKGRDYSRRDKFLEYEQPLLKELPSSAFDVSKAVMAKVQRNYHIILGEDKHQYSVPWRYAGKQTKVVYNDLTVEVYQQYKRIAIHRRDYRKYGYSTHKSHMPENHKAIDEQKGWDADYFLGQAAKTGPSTHKAISEVLASKVFLEQTYNSCLGILRLGNKYGQDRLENACKLMLTGPRVNYGILNNILKNKMDKQKNTPLGSGFTTPEHENVRGSEEFFKTKQ